MQKNVELPVRWWRRGEGRRSIGGWGRRRIPELVLQVLLCTKNLNIALWKSCLEYIFDRQACRLSSQSV
ncbi:hypothetical protein Ccrd_026005 [Cynara cardunculus var. scolymus]|uniref:Uncharacterized protein n=1 Tax=Cynara cardunculus var. scolymus TaxID=59895 RepID=A0A103T1R8_CYNCS|nr:hypothetical protein Ccrd_026005 [Cynara cardunculus var. scolymus]